MTDPVSTFFSYMFLGALFIFICGILFGIWMHVSRKSKEYRKYLTDMYVSGKIRQIAAKDKIDIASEEIAFKAWKKKRLEEMRVYELDDAIESELIEEVEKKSEPGEVLW